MQQAAAQFQGTGYREARESARAVLALDPSHADAYHMLGAVAAQQKDFAEAESMLARAIALNRRSPYFHHSLGNVHRARGDIDAAAAAYREALKLDAGFASAYLGLAVAERALGRPQEAAVQLQRYVARVPNDAEGHAELGVAFHALGDLDRALEHLRTALRIDPEHKAARHSIARVLLLAGNFREGWPAWLRSFAKLDLPDPGTASSPFMNRHVVVYGTEGVGDEIMFASCVPELAAEATDVTLHCDRRLAPLYQRSFPSVRTSGMDKEGARRTIGIVAPEEIHVLASFLPAYYRVEPGSFPSRRSFLVADASHVAEWRRRLVTLGTGLKVGVSWRGGVDPANRSRRSIPLTDWTEVLRVPGVQFVNLQHGDAAAEVEEALALGGVPLHRWADANPLVDLDFFAAEIAALDLVISVDNTNVHLAGALGTQVWALLPSVPDWRWTMAGTSTPWYRSARLFRQHDAGQWGPVVQQIAGSLRDCAAPGAAYSSGR